MPSKKTQRDAKAQRSSPPPSRVRRRIGATGKNVASAPNSAALEPAPERQTVRQPRAHSKLADLVDRMQQAVGASISEMSEATGWRAHTVRAALTGLRQRGFTVERVRHDALTRYRITAAVSVDLDRGMAA